MEPTKRLATDEEVIKLCNDVFKFRLLESPEMGTFIGFHDHDGEWDDLSEEGRQRRLEKVTEFLEIGKQLDVSSCSPMAYLSHAILMEDLKITLDGVKFRTDLMPISYMEGVHIDADLTISYMKFETEVDFQKYISRLEKLPRRIDVSIQMLKKGLEQGLALHKTSVSPIPGQLDRFLTGNIDDVGLLKPFKEKHDKIPQDVLAKFQEKAKHIVVTTIFPAFRELKEFLEKEYITKTRPQEGVCSLPNGQAYYQQCLNFNLGVYMTAQEVHDIGLREVERIRAQIFKTAAEENLGDNLQDIRENLVKREENYFKSEESVLKYVKTLCFERIRGKLLSFIKELPKIDMIITPFPPYRTIGPLGYYDGGLPDGSRKGTFFINTHDLQKCYPYLMPALSLHEGEPGHHVQITQALVTTELPDFRRYTEGQKYYLAPAKYPNHTAYSEGWGLYAEALGEEMGMYKDNFELLGRYCFEVFRAARLVVDTGLHAFGWTSEQAFEYMRENTLAGDAEIRGEINRYIGVPGQACAYKIGEIKIWDQRRKAEKELGDKFDIRDFHECILSCGRVPLSLLDSVVDKFIKEKKGL